MPFAEYKNFSDCVKKNKSKKNPEAYCASIMRAVETKNPTAHLALEMSKGKK